MHSRGNTDYKSTLLIWDTRVPKDCQFLIREKLNTRLSVVQWCAFYSTEEKSMLYVATEGSCKRDCFTFGQKRVGGNIIMKCEPPVPWTKVTDPFKIKQCLFAFLKAAYYDVFV